MVLMIDKRINEVHPVLNLAGQLVESWQGNVHLKEALKVFFLVLQVCHHLNAGQVKSVRPSLKLLQQSIQNITATSFHLDDGKCFLLFYFFIFFGYSKFIHYLNIFFHFIFFQ